MTDTTPPIDEDVTELLPPRTMGLLSVVAPVYNEQELLDEFYARVCAALDGLKFELVLVDDGSSDTSPASSPTETSRENLILLT